MRRTICVIGALMLTASYSSLLLADHPRGGQLPPGLQKKYDRGDSLPPGWRKKSSGYEYDYAAPAEDIYEPVYLEDQVIRIIRDVRDIAGSIPR